MSKFKVGDRVGAVHTDYPKNFPVGSTGIIEKVVSYSGRVEGYDVINDNSGDPYGWFFYENELELVTDAV